VDSLVCPVQFWTDECEGYGLDFRQGFRVGLKASNGVNRILLKRPDICEKNV